MALRISFSLILSRRSSLLSKIVRKTTKDVVEVTLFLLTSDLGISYVPHRPVLASEVPPPLSEQEALDIKQLLYTEK